MDSAQYERVRQLFELCRTLPQPERAARLGSDAAGDAEVEQEVRGLLEAYDRSGDFLEQPALELQADIVARAIRPAAELSPGTRIGHYEIEAAIGSGGMGVVYRASDTVLGREVALKILPPAVAQDPKRRARFQSEARALAALNHANIASIYGVEDGALVMELVPGPTLEELMEAGPIPLEEALEIAKQITEGLEAAHERGITHRDLKPANIKLTPGGDVKLLDFGLAKSTDFGSGDGSPRISPTISPAVTESGLILGTASYMAPEQAAGKVVDKRADIWAFGVVLFEMLSRRRLFEAETVAQTLANVLQAQIDLSALPPSTPHALRKLLRRCLERDPKKRLRDMGEARIVLQGLPDEEEQAAGEISGRGAIRRIAPWIVAAGAVAGLALFGVLYLRNAKPALPEMRVDIVVPEMDHHSSFALSPDGRRIAFAASGAGPRRLWERELDSTSAQPLPGTEGAIAPFWSPDGRSLAFFADLKLKRIDLGGSQPQILEAVASSAPQGTWGGNGMIVFTPSGLTPLSLVPASGGAMTVAVKLPKTENNQLAPRFLPGGRKFLFVVNSADPGIWLASLDGAMPRRITSITLGTDSAPEYLPPGWLVRVRQNVLEAQRFDAGQGRLYGDPVALDRSVRADPLTLAGSFSVSASGTIAWRSGGGGGKQLMWFNRSGEKAGTIGDIGDSTIFSPEISPDGRRVATMRGPIGSSDIWVHEGIRNRRITLDPGDDRYPIWSPNGARVAFASNRNGSYDLYEKAVDGSGKEQLLLQSAEFKRPNSWSPDGRFILYWAGQNKGDLMVLPVAGDREPFPFVSTPFNEQQGVFSPDGKWVAYQSDESESFEIYVQPFPGPGGQYQVSVGGGQSPRWRADGRALYYLAPDWKLMSARVEAHGATFTAETPVSLFQTQIDPATNKQQYDVARDGRFLILTDLPDTSAEPIRLLLNWKPPSR